MNTWDGFSRFRLGTGVLSLSVDEKHFARDLFEVAERINPKRSFLFVSTVLGRHIPVRPREHFAAVDAIVGRIPDGILCDSVMVMGYAETAVGIGAAVARQISRRWPDLVTSYLSTTRHPLAEPTWTGFSEVHSHAASHHIRRPEADLFDGSAVTLVLVDDETTTGNTFAALLAALMEQRLTISNVVLLTLTDWSGGDAVRALASVAPDLQVDSFTLLRGRWGWEPDTAAVLPDLPVWNGSVGAAPWTPDLVTDPILRAPRLGIRMHEPDTLKSGMLERLAERLRPNPSHEPVLVIGTGEHVWGPMLLAERLEQEGAEVRFVGTTRSPILPGEVIRYKTTFSDHFGAGVPMYLHNVPANPEARVIVMTETGANGICAELRAFLGRGEILDGTGQVTEFGTP